MRMSQRMNALIIHGMHGCLGSLLVLSLSHMFV